MIVRALALALAMFSCGSPRPRGDAAVPASPALPSERTPSACKAMARVAGRPTTASAWESLTLDRDHDLTIRVLSSEPFLFQAANPGTRQRAAWYELEISSAIVDAQLAALPFGAVVRVHYQAPPIMNSDPPPRLTALPPGPVPAADPALIAEWHPENGEGEIQVYADGHALVTAPPHPLIDTMLSQAELDDLLDSFARVKFDTLTSPPRERRDRYQVPGRVAVLLCESYQQVSIPEHATELAPLAAAFARIRDQTLARARPLLRVADTGWRPRIFAWPADAPPLDNNWYALKFLAAERAAAGDDSSPMYHPLPADLAAALAAVEGSHRVIVRDHGVWWGLAVERCASCRAGTYSSIVLEQESWQEPPDWAPDFATIGEAGLWLDGRDPRLKTLDRMYRQHGEIFVVWQTEAIPPPKP